MVAYYLVFLFNKLYSLKPSIFAFNGLLSKKFWTAWGYGELIARMLSCWIKILVSVSY